MPHKGLCPQMAMPISGYGNENFSGPIDLRIVCRGTFDPAVTGQTKRVPERAPRKHGNRWRCVRRRNEFTKALVLPPIHLST